MVEAVPHRATTATAKVSAFFVLRGKRASYTLPLKNNKTGKVVTYTFYIDRVTEVKSQAHIEVLRSKRDTFAETDKNGVELRPDVSRRGMGPITMSVITGKDAEEQPSVDPPPHRPVDPALDAPAHTPAVEKDDLHGVRHLSRDQRIARDNKAKAVEVAAPKNAAQVAREKQQETSRGDETGKAFPCPHCGDAFHNTNMLTKHVMLQCVERGSVAQA